MEKQQYQELLAAIKDQNEIAAVISDYVTLKRSGRSLLGLCPFHNEKTPSFNVNQTRQFFYCFGCGAGGDVFSFLMKLENLDFISAARLLAQRAGITWPESAPAAAATEQKEELFRINHLVASFYLQCLIKTEAGSVARRYLEQRGIAPASWERFRLGYAPAGWHTLTDLLRKKEVPLAQAERLGLIGFGENGYFDRLRERIIFPITNLQGRVVGFGGRVLEQGEPKYLNSSETPLFHKGHFCYGLDLAKEAIKRQGRAVIVEGYLDAIQAHQAGATETVASLGTALTREQAKLLTRYTPAVVLAYDADSAGQNATLRGMELLQQAGLAVRIARLPTGDDPDSFIRKQGAAAWGSLLEQALELTDFQLERALETQDIQTPEGKLKAVQMVLPPLAAIKSTVASEAYVRKVARRIGVSETSILAELKGWKKRPVTSVPEHEADHPDGQGSTVATNLHPLEPARQLSPLQQAIFNAEKEVLTSTLQEYDKFERIKEELKLEELSFEPWRTIEQLVIQTGLNAANFQLRSAELSASIRETIARLLAEAEIAKRQVDLAGSVTHLQSLRLQARIQALTEEINRNQDQTGQPLSAAELKAKMIELQQLGELSKQYPHFRWKIDF